MGPSVETCQNMLKWFAEKLSSSNWWSFSNMVQSSVAVWHHGTIGTKHALKSLPAGRTWDRTGDPEFCWESDSEHPHWWAKKPIGNQTGWALDCHRNVIGSHNNTSIIIYQYSQHIFNINSVASCWRLAEKAVVFQVALSICLWPMAKLLPLLAMAA